MAWQQRAQRAGGRGQAEGCCRTDQQCGCCDPRQQDGMGCRATGPCMQQPFRSTGAALCLSPPPMPPWLHALCIQTTTTPMHASRGRPVQRMATHLLGAAAIPSGERAAAAAALRPASPACSGWARQSSLPFRAHMTLCATTQLWQASEHAGFGRPARWAPGQSAHLPLSNKQVS